MQKKCVPLIFFSALAFLSSACSSTTYKGSSYQRTVTTYLEISADVPARVRIGEQDLGITPVSFPFNYEEVVGRQIRSANYWETNPGTAAALTVMSFGFYLPFSFIPAEPTSENRPAGTFVKNKVILQLQAEGHEPLEHSLECKGEPKIDLKLSLKPKLP